MTTPRAAAPRGTALWGRRRSDVLPAPTETPVGDALRVLCEAVTRAAAGDLEARVPELPGEGAQPELAAVRAAINALLDTGDAFVREATATLTAASEGRFHRRFLRRGFPGAYARAATVIDGARSDLQRQRERSDGREQELVAAREVAEQAGNAKAAFLATMSHEIRTPLNAVIGLTDLVLSTELTEDQRSQLETINRSGDSLLTLLNDILDFSKIEAGGLDLECAPFDLYELVHAVVDLLSPQAETRRLDLLVDLADDRSRHLVGDAGRLRQVLVNLVANAVKFTERGEIVVSVRTGEIVDGIAEIELAVSDTGIGIAPGAQDTLFETFRQIDQSATRSHGGTGLGLAISRRIARAMDGDVTVASTQGIGSTFTLTVRAQTTDAPAPETSFPLAGLNVLVVDDSETNRRILRAQVERYGGTCTTCPDAAATLALLDTALPFDVAVLDLHMPQVDGVELARHLHARTDTGTLPLVLLSSAVLPAGGENEFAARLHKPASPEQLVRTLTVAVTRRPGPEPLPALSPPPVPVADTQPPGPLALRILVAEDHPVNQHLMQRYLQRLGHCAVLVDNGAEAVTAASRSTYDVVLMDGQMPIMGGVAATRAIRALRQPQPRIIAVTASAFAGDRDAFMDAGANDFLTKPLRLAALAAALDAPARLPAPVLDPPPDVLDPEIVEELRSLGEETFTELYAGFAGNVVAGAEDLAALAARGEAVDRAAHKLKGSSSSYGASRVATLCRELEELASASPAQATAVAALQVAAVQARDAILELVDAMPDRVATSLSPPSPADSDGW